MDKERVLDVGCGTGSLIVALPETANITAVTRTNRARVYVDHVRARKTDPRITIEQADAWALPFGDASFDRAVSMLVLQFIPDGERA